jgi:hypothetical protein
VRLVLALLLAPALAGCTFPQGGCDFPGHWVASWEDPALAGALPADGTRGRFQLRTTSPSPGLPFPDAGRGALVSVRWGGLPDSASGREYLLLNRTAGAEGLLDGSRSITDIQGLFLDFARNLSAAPEPELAAASRTFYQSRQPGAYGTAAREPEVVSYSYRAALPGPLRLGEHFNATGLQGGPTNAGRATFQGEGWTYEFERGVRRAEGLVEGRAVVVIADPAGPVSWTLEAQEDVPEPAARAALNATFQDLGLPAPQLPLQYLPGPVC